MARVPAHMSFVNCPMENYRYQFVWNIYQKTIWFKNYFTKTWNVVKIVTTKNQHYGYVVDRRLLQTTKRVRSIWPFVFANGNWENISLTVFQRWANRNRKYTIKISVRFLYGGCASNRIGIYQWLYFKPRDHHDHNRHNIAVAEHRLVLISITIRMLYSAKYIM